MLLAVDRFPPLIGRMLNLDFGIIKPQLNSKYPNGIEEQKSY